MIKISTLLLSMLLVGCGHNQPIPEPIVTVEYRYVVISPPTEITELPDRIPTPDPSTATQKEVAKWVVDLDQRIRLLESKLTEVVVYTQQRIESLEKSGISPQNIQK